MVEEAGTTMRREQDAAESTAGEAKRAQILAGARKIFLAKGFAASSMGEIARAAGVSKGTLYVYFDSKTALFEALIGDMKRNTAERLVALDPEDHDVGAVLTDFATRFITELTAPAHISLVRMVIGAAEAFPDLSRAFFNNGAAYGAGRLAEWLAAQAREGVLALDDPQDAAWRFIGMCNQPAMISVVCGCARPDAAEIDRRARGAVRAFLAASRAV